MTFVFFVILIHTTIFITFVNLQQLTISKLTQLFTFCTLESGIFKELKEFFDNFSEAPWHFLTIVETSFFIEWVPFTYTFFYMAPNCVALTAACGHTHFRSSNGLSAYHLICPSIYLLVLASLSLFLNA